MENRTESVSDMGKTGSKQTKLDGTDKKTYYNEEVAQNRGDSSIGLGGQIKI